MSKRYQLRDSHLGGAISGRFTSLDRAMRELAACVGVEGRFYIYDREECRKVATHSDTTRYGFGGVVVLDK